MFLVVVIFFIRKVVLIGIIEFVVEVMWLFALSWPKYPVQRWTHIVRSLAVMLWQMDTLFLLLKLVANSPIVAFSFAY